MQYFLGADLGGTKTHLVIADEGGRVVGFSETGPGNHQSVGYEGMFQTLKAALGQALSTADLSADCITAAGFGIAGYDWPSEKDRMMHTIERLGLDVPFAIVNDATLGLVAGAEGGWGVAIVSGTGCNCRGWDRQHRREGKVTGYGILMGEAAGGTELVYRAMQAIAHAWTHRGPATTLSQAFVNHIGAQDLGDLLEGYALDRYHVGAEAAPIVFHAANQGDLVAQDLIHWAGCELGELANAIIRQLEFENLAFDVVLIGSMFEGGARLIDPLRQTIHQLAPKARLVRLDVPPVVGAVLIAMMESGLQPAPELRKTIANSLASMRPGTLE